MMKTNPPMMSLVVLIVLVIGLTPTTASPQCPAVQTCPTSWNLYGAYCFRYFSTPLSVSDASLSCQASQAGATLAAAKDLGMNQFIYQLYLDANPGESGYSVGVWIGLTQSPGIGNSPWTWTANVNWSYRNWLPREPNSANENCVHIGLYANNDKWNDSLCSRQKSYVCMVHWKSGR